MTSSRWTVLALVVAAAAAGAAALFGFGGTTPTASEHCKGGCKLLFGPVEMKGGYVQVERHPGRGSNAIPRVRVVSNGKAFFDDGDMPLMLSAFTYAIGRKKPFILVWDCRRLAWPKISRAQVRMLRAWFGGNFLKWDKHMQAHVCFLSNPLARAFTKFVVRIFRPPQPIHIGRTDDDAVLFIRDLPQPRSYVKSDAEYNNAPGWKKFVT